MGYNGGMMTLATRPGRPVAVFLAVCLLSLLAASVASCGKKAGLQDSARLLERSVRSACAYIRWGHWDKLAALMRPYEGGTARAEPKPQPLEDIRVTSCEPRSIDAEEPGGDSQLAVSVADIKFHTTSTISIHEFRHVHNWWRDEETGRWYLDSVLPDFCGAMGGRHKSC